jgi:hypothetical protein
MSTFLVSILVSVAALATGCWRNQINAASQDSRAIQNWQQR